MELQELVNYGFEEISLIIPANFPKIYKRPVKIQQVLITPYYGTCSCSLHRMRARLYPKGDLRRVCKHLYQFYKTKASEYFEEVSMIFLDLQFWFFGESQIKILTDGKIYIITNIQESIKFEIFFDGKWQHRRIE